MKGTEDIVPAGFQLAVSHSAPGGSTIYYTLDGSDPREFGGTVSTSALTYSAPVTLTKAFTVVKSRVLHSNGEWSPLSEAGFKVAGFTAAKAFGPNNEVSGNAGI